MDPIISNKKSTNDSLEFEIGNVDVSIVNALRRVILTRIECLVFKGFPHDENKIHIEENKSSFHNEYLKHRIQCIPIHEEDSSKFANYIENYYISLDVENETNKDKYVTTKDFRLFTKKENKEIPKEEVYKLFPPDPISKDFILICILSPKYSDKDPNEKIKMKIYFSVGTANDDSCWNVVSNSVYYFKPKESIIKEKVNKIPEEKQKDYLLLDSQREYINNQFIFKTTTIGVYTNEQIILKATNYLIKKINELQEFLSKPITLENPDKNQLENYHLFYQNENDMYRLFVKDDDYTIGKIIEKEFYSLKKDKLTFISFKKDHPHDNYGIIDFIYKKETLLEVIIVDLMDVSKNIISIYDKVNHYFTN